MQNVTTKALTVLCSMLVFFFIGCVINSQIFILLGIFVPLAALFVEAEPAPPSHDYWLMGL